MARADAVVNLPIAGSYRIQTGYGCGVNQDDPCDTTTQFTGLLSIDLPSLADGDYYAAGIGFAVTGVGRELAFTSDMDHAAEVSIRNGYVVGYSLNAGVDGCCVFGAHYGGGMNAISYDEQESHSDFTLEAVRQVPEPVSAMMLVLAVGVGTVTGRRSQVRRR